METRSIHWVNVFYLSRARQNERRTLYSLWINAFKPHYVFCSPKTKSKNQLVRLSSHFALVFSVRKSGYRQCVGYLLANTRLRLDDFYQFYPADKLFDLFIGAIPTTTAEILARESVNVSGTATHTFSPLGSFSFRSRTFFVSTRSSPIELKSKRMFVNLRWNRCRRCCKIHRCMLRFSITVVWKDFWKSWDWTSNETISFVQ